MCKLLERVLFPVIIVIVMLVTPVYPEDNSDPNDPATGENKEQLIEAQVKSIGTQLGELNAKFEKLKEEAKKVTKQVETTEEKVDQLGITRSLFFAFGMVVFGLAAIFLVRVLLEKRDFKRHSQELSGKITKLEKEMPRPRPIITDVRPKNPPIWQKERIRIAGYHFKDIKQIFLGNKPVPIRRIERTGEQWELSVEIPTDISLEDTIEPLDIKVETAYGLARRHFSFCKPELKINPIDVPAAGGYCLIEGSGFGPDTEVNVEKTRREKVYVSESKLLVEFPAETPPKEVDVEVCREDGRSKKEKGIYK